MQKGQRGRRAQDTQEKKESIATNEEMSEKWGQYLRDFDPNKPLHEQEFAKSNCMKMEKELNSYCINRCPECGEGKLEKIESSHQSGTVQDFFTDICQRCLNDQAKRAVDFDFGFFSKQNSMLVGEVPPELQGLSIVEQFLIAICQPCCLVYDLKGGNGHYRGHIISIAQDIQEFAQQLPNLPSSLQILVVLKEGIQCHTC